MAQTLHHQAAGKRAVPVEIVIVSSSRSASDDRSGPVLAEGLRAAGHTVTGSAIVPDDGAAITAKLDATRKAGAARALLFSGGTGLSARDGTFEAVRGKLDKEIPGFGELFRMLSYAEVGAAAMLSRATAGLCGDLVVFVIPGSPAACRLALEKLILPELSHIVYELGKEGPAPADAASASPTQSAPLPIGEPVATGAGVSEHVGHVSAREIPFEPKPDEKIPDIGWRLAVLQLNATLLLGERLAIPEALNNLAGVVNVLNDAGEQGVLVVGEERYAIYGYPDLRRPASRVLLVGAGEPYGEVIALHRWPRLVGLCRKGGGRLPSRGHLSRTAEQVTGRDYPGEGRLLAVDNDAVYVADDEKVTRWDGSRSTSEGQVPGAVVSLLLRWSQK